MDRKFLAALFVCAIAAVPVPADASSLAGQTISINLTAGGSDFGTQSILVGPGEDGNYFGNQFLDLNAGISGDLFTIRSTSNFCGIICSGVAQWTLTNLNFGAPLIGFSILTSNAPVTIDLVTATSLVFSYPDLAIPFGTYFEGQFVIGIAATPIPGALPLMGTVLGGGSLLGWWRRRRSLRLHLRLA